MSVLAPSTGLTYLGIGVDVSDRHLSIAPTLKLRVCDAVANASFRSGKFAQHLEGFVNFVRPVAKLPLQIVIAVLRRDPKLTALVRNGHIDHPWQLSAEEYRARFHRHDAWLASDATPNALGLADPSGTLYIPLPVHFILFPSRGTSERLLGLTGSGHKAGM